MKQDERKKKKVGCFRAEEDEAVVVWGDPEPRGHGRTDIQSTERIFFFLTVCR